MMNLTSKTSKSFLLFKRALVLLCLVLCSLITNAGTWNATYRGHFKSHPQSTGKGKVFISDNASNSVYKDGSTRVTAAQDVDKEQEITLALYKGSISPRNNQTYTFQSVKISASEMPGSKFEGWYFGDTSYDANNKLDENAQHTVGDVKLTWDGGSDYPDYKGPETKEDYFYAKFIARTYLLRSPAVNIITLDEKGQIIPDDRSGGKVGCAHNDESVEATSNNHLVQGAQLYSQTADNNGELAQATFIVWYAAEANNGYEFVGWTKNADATGISSQNARISERKVSTFEQGTSGTPESTSTYYAVFRRKFIGYNQPCQINIEGTGQISVDGSNWKETNITHNPTTTYVSSVTTPTPQIAVKYYAQTIADSNFDFLGWFDEEGTKVSSDAIYTYQYTPTAGTLVDLKCPPTLTAKFVPNNYYYKDYTQVIAIPEEDGETFLGKVYVDKGEYANNIDGIADSNWGLQKSVGDESAEPVNGYQFTYTYYAKPNDAESAFKEWVLFKVITDSEGNATGYEEIVLSDEAVFTYTVDYTENEWNPGEENAFTPPTLYARFQTSRYYYHGRAKVGVASNSETGSVFVSDVETADPAYYTPTDENPYYTSQETVVDKDGDGQTNPNIIETELNQSKYKYYYYAKPTATSAFKGWTAMPTGDNIISTKNPYSQEYTASETPTEVGPMNLYAVFHSYYHTLPRVVSVGSGQVKIIDKTNFQAEINDPTPIPARPDKDDEGKDKDYYTYTYTLTAQADEGATFIGWSTSDSEEDIVSRELTYTVNEITSSTSKETPHRVTMYALFESDIKIKHIDRMIYYNVDGSEYINDVNIILEVANAATLKATLSGDNAADFRLTNTTLTEQGTSLTVDATASIIPLRLMYVGKDNPLRNAVRKQVNVNFTSHDGSGTQLAANGKLVVVEEMPVVTFLPADGKGSYTVSQTDGSGITYTLGEESDQNVRIEVTHESKSYLQIHMTDKADDGMEFFAWQVIENYGTASEKISYLSYDMIYTHHFTKSVAIRPEFIPESWARYIIKSNPNVQYFDLNKAIAQAKLGVNVDEKIVVVYRSGLVPKGEYTIPKGVTLLVPGEGPGDGFGSTDYLSQINGALTADDYLAASYSALNYRCYRKLTIEDGSLLTVANGGKLCVSARLIISGQSLLAFPYHYGHIELGNDAVIDVADGATLFAWGYITNPNTQQVTIHNYKDVGRVVAQSGATVWEPMAFTDFRGGRKTCSFVEWGTLASIAISAIGEDVNGYRHNVFPINQYYVQCIEAPLTLKSGAAENLSTGIHAEGVTSVTSAVLVGSDNGLFRWNSSTATMTKYYDAAADRTKYIIEDTQNSNTAIKLGNIGLKLDLKLSFIEQTVDISSKNYVMPIHNGMDVYIKNAQVELPSGINIALLAGSSMHVDENSKVINNAQCFVYDKDQNVISSGLTTGYFASYDSQILPIKTRPYPDAKNLFTEPNYSSVPNLSSKQPSPNEGDAFRVGSNYYVWQNSEWVKMQQLKVNRDVNSITDAALVVDGSIDCTNGYLITTSSGANITSNGGGKIVVNKFGTPSTGSGSSLRRNQSAFQFNQTADGDLAVGYVAIPLATNNNTYYPRLHNSNDSYTEATTANTYYYCSGTWSTSSCTEDPDVELDYTPRFSLLTAPLLEGYVGEGLVTQTMSFELQNANLGDWSTVQWEATFTGRDANLFEFNKEENPAVTFRPASEGVKTAVMIVTATYTYPETSVKYVYSQAIDLTATALSQQPNGLQFNDLTKLFIGQSSATNLFANTGNNNEISLEIRNIDGEIVADHANLGIAGNTIKPVNKYTSTIAPDTFVVKAVQAANHSQHIMGAEISAKMIISPRVVWNWEELYYPSVNKNPITMMDGSTNWTLTEEIVDYDVVQFTGTDANTYQAEIYDLMKGEFKVKFIFQQEGYENIEFISNIYRDVRYLRVDVNDKRTFRAITVGEHEGVSYNDETKQVSIISPALETNDWTINFIGVPDKLYFTPQGDKAWQIEESTNGSTWTTTFTWAYIPEGKTFEYSLMPSTQYVRISYAAGGTAIMQDIYITKLEGVKFYPEKLYMPANPGATRNVAITYVSDANVSISSQTGEFSATPNTLDKTTAEPFYNVENVVITNTSCTDEKLSDIKITSSVGTEMLPVQTYAYPQELPIVLASDMPAERFYYVAPHTYNTTWDEKSRTITMHNAVAKAEPYVTFYFTGVPTYISFAHNADITKGEWIVEESTDGINWDTPEEHTEDEQTATFFKKIVSTEVNAENAKYIRVTYQSLFTSKIDITDLRIIGDEGAFVDKTELKVEYVDANDNYEPFTVTAINLANGMRISTDNEHFKLTHGTNAANTAQQSFTLDASTDGGIYKDIFQAGKLAPLSFKVYFDGNKAVDYTTITVTNNPGAGEELKTFATIQVIGVAQSLSATSKFFTGVPDGTNGIDDAHIEGAHKYELSGSFEGNEYRQLDIANAFANGQAIFDYLFIFGETTTTDGTNTIKTPTTLAGSNAKTPCYIYKKNGTAYEEYQIIDNANASSKITQDFLKLKAETAEELKVYITGFCPYASTGYTKKDEGIFFFQGGKDDHVHVYLQDCYLYSRAKTENGHFFESRSDGHSFTEDYVQGSGGVLVFECTEQSNKSNPFNVTIHTRGHNMFKSHYGCFLESVAGRAFQVSAPVQVHMQSDRFISGSYTVLNFDDIWPNATTGNNEHTNGFISLQKQVNNAPSIDLGNANTVVNFNGGQVELQNACNSSDNYNSTLAISCRGGKFAGFFLAHGLGSDEVSGTVNFNDGTTTVLKMSVPERYRQYYLMDENGTTTSCLRTPKNTYVYGGSHCMMRACEAATSKGGAPTDGTNPLGLYQYPHTPEEGHKGGWSGPDTYGLVTPLVGEAPEGYKYESVTPNDNGTPENLTDDYLNFWVPEDYDTNASKPELDQIVSFWKACMTYIEASFSSYGGHVGGDIVIQTDNAGTQTELVSNLLYCEIDQSIGQIIKDNYSAPVKSPLPEGEPYMSVKPSKVGKSDDPTVPAENQNYILNEKDYRIENKIYYITTATADVWTTFTAPFDVEKIYIMETRHEDDLSNDAKLIAKQGGKTYLEAMKSLQAKNNADFAAFFGVAMVIHPNKTFDQIFADYRGWANEQDKEIGKNRRNKYELKHFYKDAEGKSNWNSADYYLYRNNGQWEYNELEDRYNNQWEFVIPQNSEPLMKQDETYLMLFPYCVDCFDDGKRDYWDYWTGKFLIFESTTGPHTLHGSSFVGAKASYTLSTPDPDESQENSQEIGGAKIEDVTWSYSDESGVINTLSTMSGDNGGSYATVSGNSTFSMMETKDFNVLAYYEEVQNEGFIYGVEEPEEGEEVEGVEIQPTQSFLYTSLPKIMPSLISVLRDGTIVTRGSDSGDGNTTGTHMPTVGGGNELFITAINGGINVAVAYPQHVRVLSATGAVIYSGMVQTAVDVNLPTDGIYIVSGEREVQKILY